MKNNAQKYEGLHAHFDQLIREGHGWQCRKELHALKLSDVPRELRVHFSELSRRAGTPEFGMRLLQKYVRPEGRVPISPTHEELLEYAACLMRIGALEEAQKLLSEIKVNTDPKFNLYRAFAYISQWDYAHSIEPLRQYMQHTTPTAYEKLVAECNLLVALVVERNTQEAESLSGRLKTITLKEGHSLLYGRVAESTAQLHILNRNWQAAEQDLFEAEKALRSFGVLDQLFVSKWKAVLEIFKSPSSAFALEQVNSVIEAANEKKHWETVRSLSILTAIATKNTDLARKLYFGTRFAALRANLQRDFPGNLPTEGKFIWGDSNSAKCISIETGDRILKAGQVPHRLLTCLSSDFYRPFRIGEIHFGLYPNEYFNPVSGPQKVHRAILRLRQTLSKFDSEVNEDHKLYRLNLGGLALEIPSPNKVQVRSPALIQLAEQIGQKEFSAREAANAWQVSHRRANLRLKEALQGGSITTHGIGRATRYRLAS